MNLDAWRDKYGMIVPQPNSDSSGNGILYTSIASILLLKQNKPIEANQELNRIKDCFKTKGLMQRNPDNSFGQESWDDYMGLLTACLLIKRTDYPRQILWYGIKNAFVFRNEPNSGKKAWLWRFPHIFFIILPVAAFPILSLILWPLFPIALPLMYKLEKDTNEMSWLTNLGLSLAFIGPIIRSKKAIFLFYNKHTLQKAFDSYYGINHPFKDGLAETPE